MKLFVLLFITALATSCNSQKISKTIDTKSYEGVNQAYFQNWSGGAPGSGSGTTLYIPTLLLKNAMIEAIYFRDMVTTEYAYTDDTKSGLNVRLATGSGVPKDLIMHKDAKQEYGNEKRIPENFPFKMNLDEAIIKITINGKTQYIKLENLEEKPAVMYPSMPGDKQ